MALRSAIPFVAPVDPAEVPDYYDVIKSPMDLGTILERLQVGGRTLGRHQQLRCAAGCTPTHHAAHLPISKA